MTKEFGDKFTVTFHRDPERSGNLEVWIGEKNVWSKKTSGKFPSTNWQGFMEACKAEM